MLILGIETSCDETSAAVIETNPNNIHVRLLSNVVSSSIKLHAKTGGIIPETAAREQIKYILPVIEKALRESNLNPPSSIFYHPDIDAIAVTVGPGLIGSLLVGVETAKTLSYVWNKPIIPVNHLIGHIYANFIGEISNIKYLPAGRQGQISNKQLDARSYFLDANVEFPALALVVSGGHTDLVLIKDHGKIKWLGGTRDDAAGEAFDKIGRLLGLPYPAGPSIEKLSERGDARLFMFPRPMINSDDFDFSFSGLKTAVLRLVQNRISLNSHSGDPPAGGDSRIRFWTCLAGRQASQNDKKYINDICASVQQAIIDVLISKTLKAAQKYQVKSILLSGGVAANQKLREQFELNAKRYLLNAKIFVPQKSLCTDNAAMIASAAFFNYKETPWHKLTANPELYFD